MFLKRFSFEFDIMDCCGISFGFTKEALYHCVCIQINHFVKNTAFKYFCHWKTTPGTFIYYYELVPQAGKKDIITVLIIYGGHVDGDTAFSGQSLKTFNAAARIPDQ